MRLTILSLSVRLLDPLRQRLSRISGFGVVAFVALVASLSASTTQSAAQSPIAPKDHFAAPNGTPAGDGSFESPWDFVTALEHPAAVRPGDTIWVRGGLYEKRHPDMWQPKLTGTPAAPVVVRTYPGERVQVTGPWRIFGADAWYCGFEHTYLGTESRISTQSGSGPTDQPIRGWVAIYGDRVKVINPVIHDLNEGINFFGGGSLDSQVYGAIVFNVGWQGTDRGNGNGAYIQSAAGTKWITDCIAFNTFATGMKGYGTAAAVKGLVFEGLMNFNAGAYAVDTSSQGGPSQNLLVTSEKEPVDGIVVQNCAFYHSAWNNGNGAIHVRLGNGNAPGVSVKVLNNYMAGGSGLVIDHYASASVLNNFVYARQTTSDKPVFVVGVGHDGAVPPYQWGRNTYVDGSLPWAGDGRRYSFMAAAGYRAWTGGRIPGWLETTGYDQNSTYTAGRPTATRVIVRPNRHETGRAHVAVYNWGGASTVHIDASAVGLRTGDRYEVLDVQNLLAGPVASGTFGGRAIPVPMNLTTVAPATGMTWAPAHTAPEFAVFLIRPVRRLTTVTPPAGGVGGGNKASVSVTITPPAPEGGAIVALTSSAPNLARTPSFVKVPAGASSAWFDVATSIVSADTPVSLTASYMGGSQSADLVLRPLLGSVAVSPYRVLAGLPVTGKVTLNGVGLAGGTVVALSSDMPFATVPLTVTVPEGAASATFMIATDPALTADGIARISATLDSTGASCLLTVKKRALSGFSVSPLTIFSGTAANGIVAINGRALDRGAVISMSSSKPTVAWAPGRVTVSPNATSISFPVNANAVTSDTPVTITASYNGTSKSVVVTVNQFGLTAVAASSNRIMAGDAATGTVTLAAPAKSGGTVVALASSIAAATVPASVTVPAGAASVTFPIATDAASRDAVGTLSASFAGVTRSYQVTVKARALYAVRMSATTMASGGVATGTVVLGAPALPGGAVVTLASSSAAAEVPATVTVPEGKVTATFNVAAKSVLTSTSVTLTGSCGGVSKSVLLTVTP